MMLFAIPSFSQTAFSYRWACNAGTDTINGHPALSLGGGNAPVLDSVPFHAAYTVVAVYRSADDSAEGQVWRLGGADSLSRSLTTQRLLLGRTGVRYDSLNRRGPVINCIMQSAPDTGEGAPHAVPLRIGDSTGGVLHMAELLQYPSRLGFVELTRVQSILAIRYGVTLGPVDYETLSGTKVWLYERDSAYHHRITGVARDSVCGLMQLRSTSGHDGALLTIAADSLPDGCYCLAGDDGGAVAFAGELWTEYLQRTWKVRLTGGDNARPSFTLTFNTAAMQCGGDTLLLCIGDTMYMPSSVTGGGVVFRGVTFASDTALLRLARPSTLPGDKSVRGRVLADNAGKGTTAFDFTSSVYPNPTTGSYTISVSCGGSVQVTVHDMLGVQVASFSGEGSEEYLFSGSLPVAGTYYVTVTTAGGSQTCRLAVK